MSAHDKDQSVGGQGERPHGPERTETAAALHPSHPNHPLHPRWLENPDLYAEHEFAMYGGDDPNPPQPKHFFDHPQHGRTQSDAGGLVSKDHHSPTAPRSDADHHHSGGFAMPDPYPGFQPLQHADTYGAPPTHVRNDSSTGAAQGGPNRNLNRTLSTGALIRTRRVNVAAGTKAKAMNTDSRGQYWLAKQGKAEFPDPLVSDPAFEHAHRVRSRAASVGQKSESGMARLTSITSREKDEEEGSGIPPQDPNKVTWAEGDPENPQNWSRTKKWALTLLGALLTVNVTFASSEPASGTRLVMEEFNVIMIPATVALTSMFLLGYVAGPVLWGSLSELYGRKIVFAASLLAYTLFQIGCALAQNYGTLVVCRFFAGMFAAAPLTNSGGLIADIWDPVTRGKAMSLFTASVFLGPCIGPIVGGFVAQSYLGWRWLFWIIMIFAGFCWIICVLFLPETYSPVLLARRARKLRKQDPVGNKDLYADHERADFSVSGIVTRTLGRPFKMLAVEPILLLVTIYMSIVYGLLYGLFEAFPLIWQEGRGFNPGESGLVFIAIGIGTTIGAGLNVWLQRGYRKQLEKYRGHPPPEGRLNSALVAGPCLIIGSFWLGWTGAYFSVPWYVPALGAIVLGISFTLIFISFLTYIIEVYLMYSASALAANTIVRSGVAASFPLFTTPWFNAIGIQWACTMIGLVALILAPAPLLFMKYGARIRMHSQFAPALDIHIADEIEAEKKAQEGINDDSSSATVPIPERDHSPIKEEPEKEKDERESDNVATPTHDSREKQNQVAAKQV